MILNSHNFRPILLPSQSQRCLLLGTPFFGYETSPPPTPGALRMPAPASRRRDRTSLQSKFPLTCTHAAAYLHCAICSYEECLGNHRGVLTVPRNRTPF